MSSATVTSKGPVAVPADVRAKLGIRPGSKIDSRVVEATTAEATIRLYG
jgi:AbrB family looped-hinge helix DNA binding protein